MKLLRRVALLCAGLWAPALALAQALVAEPSRAVQCLTPGPAERGEPEYPLEAFKLSERGRVKVALTFESPDERPAVEVMENDGGRSFVEAVRTHVRSYRVPCLAKGDKPVRLEFQFLFQPDDRRVAWSAPTDPKDAERRELAKCITHTSGSLVPTFPRWAAARGIQGRVRMRYQFSAPDQPPTVEAFSRPRHRELKNYLVDWAEGLRMPCYQGEPTQVSSWYVFQLERDVYGFKPGVTLMDLLPLIKDIHAQTVAFDTTRMACPFDIALVYQQPDVPNAVGEIGNADASRRQFMSWLANQQLDIPDADMDSIYGDTVKFTVPCIKLNLKPKEKI